MTHTTLHLYDRQISDFFFCPEYWIVDPIERKIAVLVLDQGSYTKTVFSGDEALSSPTFAELKLAVRSFEKRLAQ